MNRFIETYQGDLFDAIIIGGGITGAAVAYELASRGLNVALLEKKDYGWATSAATSKLIHGGLRYIQNFEFGLVRESLQERRILENIAPNFVYPIPFLVPGYVDLKRNKWILRLGLSLYDQLAFDKTHTRDKSKKVASHHWLSKEQIMSLEPDVRQAGLTGGSIYYDCQSINPERLTLSFIKSAHASGAKVANYCAVDEFIFDSHKDHSGQRKIRGVLVHDLHRNKTVPIYSRLVVNCAGPWADIVYNQALGLNHTKPGHGILRSEGIHIISRKFKPKQAIVMWTPSGRHFFMVPWRGRALIGTTDKRYQGDPDAYRVSHQSLLELIQDINDSIGDGKMSLADVDFYYGGLRPLVEDGSKRQDSYGSSRKYQIVDHTQQGLLGLLTVEGGKYTTSRHLAENVALCVANKLGQRLRPSMSREKFLVGCQIGDMEHFVKEIAHTYHDFSSESIEYMTRNYGSDCYTIFELARSNRKLARQISDDGQLLAEVAFVCQWESCIHLDDIVFRRCGIGNVGNPGEAILDQIGQIAAKKLHWNRRRRNTEIENVGKRFSLP